jgi:alpha-1,6-mannosyltransferase
LLHFSRYSLFVFAAFYGWVMLRLFRRSKYGVSDLLEHMGWVTVVLMLYATSWVMPWYSSSLYAIAAIVPQAQLFTLTTLAFGVSSGWSGS